MNRRGTLKSLTASIALGLALPGAAFAQAGDTIKVGILHSLSCVADPYDRCSHLVEAEGRANAHRAKPLNQHFLTLYLVFQRRTSGYGYP